MKKHGRVRAIPVKEVTEGMQVIDRFNNVSKVVRTDPEFVVVAVHCRDGEIRHHNDQINKLKTLVVEYEDGYITANGGQLETTKQLPLKYSQWQSAIDNGEVDSDKVVEFEIKNLVGGIEFDGHADPKTNHKDLWIAKIIPQKKRMYTQEEVDHLINEERCKAVQQVLENQISENPKRNYSEMNKVFGPKDDPLIN